MNTPVQEENSFIIEYKIKLKNLKNARDAYTKATSEFFKAVLDLENSNTLTGTNAEWYTAQYEHIDEHIDENDQMSPTEIRHSRVNSSLPPTVPDAPKKRKRSDTPLLMRTLNL
jgi:hypothetical protein